MSFLSVHLSFILSHFLSSLPPFSHGVSTAHQAVFRSPGIYRIQCGLLGLFPFSSTCHIGNYMFNVCLLFWTVSSPRAEKCSALFPALSSYPEQYSVHNNCSITVYQKTQALLGLCISLHCLRCLMSNWASAAPYSTCQFILTRPLVTFVESVSAFSNAYKTTLSQLSLRQEPHNLSEGFGGMSEGQSPSWAVNWLGSGNLYRSGWIMTQVRKSEEPYKPCRSAIIGVTAEDWGSWGGKLRGNWTWARS